MDTFKPQYNAQFKVTNAFIPIFACVALWFFFYSKKELSIVAQFITISAPIFTLLIPFNIIKQIEFGDKIMIKRYIVPPKVFQYSDLEDIKETMVIFRNGKIVTGKMKNDEELIQMLGKHLNKKK